MNAIPRLLDVVEWRVSGRSVLLCAGELVILRGAFVGQTGSVRLDWRGAFRSLDAASRALGLRVSPTADAQLPEAERRLVPMNVLQWVSQDTFKTVVGLEEQGKDGRPAALAAIRARLEGYGDGGQSPPVGLYRALDHLERSVAADPGAPL